VAIYRIAYREDGCQATLYNHGCNWDCSICSYKLREGFAPTRFLSTRKVLDNLSSFKLERLVVLGGEPLTCPDLNRIVAFAKEKETWVKVAHSNASLLPPVGVDEIGISLRAISKRKHLQLTGVSNSKVLSNFYTLHDRGIAMQVSTILIPEVVDAVEISKIAEFLASVDVDLPFHITAYLPVPGLSWRAPAVAEMARAVVAAKEHLTQVSCSAVNEDTYLASSAWDTVQHRNGVY
jgi:pyruvate formate lyase activating enzyme